MKCFAFPGSWLFAIWTGFVSCWVWGETAGIDDDKLTDTWIVRTSGYPLESSLLQTWKANDLGSLGNLKGFYILDFSQSELAAHAIESLLEHQENILWFERQKREFNHQPSVIPGTPAEDPRFGDSWHITNAGLSGGKKGEDLNLLPTWDWGIDGTGILVGVVDEGVELDHPDLKANIRQDLSLDLVATGSSKNKLNSDENHGTAVAGIIAADDNLIGSVGVAYGSKIVPVRYLGVTHTDSDSAVALSYQNNLISIYNNSWGPSIGESGNEVALTGASTLGSAALSAGATEGRSGRGNIFVFAAGNNSEKGGNVNYNSWANSRYTIAVAAVGNGGKHVTYSEEGAPILVSAPSGGQSLGVFTTDRSGAFGYNETDDYTNSFSGTSAAAPMVSGVVALLLQSNPGLTWRDVQHILVKSAIQVDHGDEGWKVNAAGLPFNDKYGFGRVDASSAIQTAIKWENVSSEISTSGTRNQYQSIPANGAAIESTITLSRDLKIEHVYVTPSINHSDWGDLKITLISPSGTESLLSEPHTDFTKTYSSWTYTSAQFWDEAAVGTWTLRVEDLGTGGTGSLSKWTLKVFGTAFDEERNLDPIAVSDEVVSTTYPLTIPVLANDFDPDGDPLYIISIYQPSYGEATISENQEIVYTPDESTFQGIDEFGYSLSDGRGGTTDTLVQVIHPGPVAIADQAVVYQNGTVSLPVLANDFDRSNDPLELLSVSIPENGSASIEDSKIRYTPVTDFVGYDDFTYTVTDNKDGNETGSIRVYTSGDPDFALLFDGVNDFVMCETSSAFNITGSITLEASFYLRSYGELGNVGFGRILDRGTYSLLVNGSDHEKYPDHCLVFAATLSNGSTATANTPADTIQLNRWHKVAVSYEGTTVSMFIDGKQVQTGFSFDTAFTGAIASDTTPLYIGENAAGTRAFNGIIDWVRIWNKVLPSSRIITNDLFVDENSREGLVGWFQFNEGVGWQTLESMGNGGSATVSEALWIPKDPSMLATAIESSLSH